MDLGELLSAGVMRVPGEGRKPLPLPIPEAAIETIAEMGKAYGQRQWKVGDWVTPRKGGPYVNKGYPCLVVEVSYEKPHTFEGAGPSDPEFQSRYDIRFMTIARAGGVRCWWAESWEFEAYVPGMEVVE